MIDIKIIRQDPELVALKTKQKGHEDNIKLVLKLDKDRRSMLAEIEDLRKQRNELVHSSNYNDQQVLQNGKDLKQKITKLESDLREVELSFNNELKKIPNLALDNVPIGQSEKENLVIRQVGEKRQFDFKPKLHHELAFELGLIDSVRAVKISGSRFAYLKGDLVRLQFAIMNFVINTLSDEVLIKSIIDQNNLNVSAKPFTPVLPPALLKTEPYLASSRLNAEEVTYKIEQDDLWLNASAEHTLCTMYWNEILSQKDLPIRYIGYATSFRREAGTYGKDMEGIFRMHQFDKLEMEVFSTAKTGLEEHLLLIALQEHLMQKLELPYQVLQKCTADIGKPNAVGVDIEVWLPGQERYRETHTADYLTDYQSRDLKIRVKNEDNTTELVHTNDATAFALGRIMIAILENYQLADGHIAVPEVLIPYMAGKTLI